LEELCKQGFVVETGEAKEGVVGIAALGIALRSDLNRRGKTLCHFIDLIGKICDDISCDLGYVDLKLN
jgi:hypothetical protein